MAIVACAEPDHDGRRLLWARRDDREGGTPNLVCSDFSSGVHDGRSGKHTAKLGDAGARGASSQREGKVVRPDGESQDSRVATGGLGVTSRADPA